MKQNNVKDIIENIKARLLLQQEEIEEYNGLDYCKNCGISGKELYEELTTLIDKVREEAVIGFVDYMYGQGFNLETGSREPSLVRVKDFVKAFLQSIKEEK